jgi:hypothetical protein
MTSTDIKGFLRKVARTHCICRNGWVQKKPSRANRDACMRVKCRLNACSVARTGNADYWQTAHSRCARGLSLGGEMTSFCYCHLYLGVGMIYYWPSKAIMRVFWSLALIPCMHHLSSSSSSPSLSYHGCTMKNCD